MASSKSVEESFAPHFEEIKRRAAVKESLQQQVPSKTNFKKSDHLAPTEFHISDQSVVLYSVSHRGVPPITLTGKGAFRVYGVFSDAAEAAEHARLILDGVDPGVSMFTSRTHEWISVLSSIERFGDPEAADKLRTYVLSKHEASLDRDKREFDDVLENTRAVTISEEDKEGGGSHSATTSPECASDDEEGDPADDEAEDDVVLHPVPEGGRRARRTLPASVRLAGQRFAVVSVLYDDKDEATDGEFLLKVYACFDDVQEADAWVRNVAAPKVQDVALDIVTTCSWISPASMKVADAPKEVFRQEELDNIMSYHKAEPERVTEYETWRKEQDALPSSHTADADRLVEV